MRVPVCLFVASLGFAGVASSQQQYQGQEPQKLSLSELTRGGGRYNDTPVIVIGELRYGDIEDQNRNIYELRDRESIQTVRVGTSQRGFDDLRFMIGSKVEVSGIFFDMSNMLRPESHPVLRYFPGAQRTDGLGFDRNYFIAVMNIEVIEELESDLKPADEEDQPDIVDPDIDTNAVLDLDLRQLVKDPSKYVDRQLVVLGKFRGNNLYGDLSIKAKRTPRDFVIKTADAAIWVTGRRPRGDGFRLDPKKRRDTGKWLRVYGTPWEYNGTYYLRAEKIEMVDKPEDPDLEPVKVVRAEEEALGPPPEVTFTLPLEGEREVALDSEFHVQFSNDMRADSFNRNVDLLYADDDGIENPFPELEVLYNDDNRTLTVKPNKVLDPGQEVVLILYDAIEDTDGQKLRPQPGAGEVEPGAAVVLTYATALR